MSRTTTHINPHQTPHGGIQPARPVLAPLSPNRPRTASTAPARPAPPPFPSFVQTYGCILPVHAPVTPASLPPTTKSSSFFVARRSKRLPPVTPITKFVEVTRKAPPPRKYLLPYTKPAAAERPDILASGFSGRVGKRYKTGGKAVGLTLGLKALRRRLRDEGKDDTGVKSDVFRIKRTWYCAARSAGCDYSTPHLLGAKEVKNRTAYINARRHMHFCPIIHDGPVSNACASYDPAIHKDMPFETGCNNAKDGCPYRTWGPTATAAGVRLAHHQNACAYQSKTWTCPDCDKEVPVSQSKNHFQKCSGKDRVECEVCKKVCSRRDLSRHQEESCLDHELYGSRPVICELCDHVSLGPRVAKQHWCGQGEYDGNRVETCVSNALIEAGIVSTKVVIIEVDEYAHISYSTKEAPQERSIGLDFDSSRARRIYETFEDDEVLIFIRLNPDRYSINKKRVSGIRYQERVKALKDWLAGLDRDLEPDFYLAYFYYPIFNGKLVELSKDYFDEESKEHILEVIN